MDFQKARLSRAREKLKLNTNYTSIWKQNARASLSILCFFLRAKTIFFRETLNQGQPQRAESSKKLLIFNNNKAPLARQ